MYFSSIKKPLMMRIIFIMFCSYGCIHQITDLMLAYFQYPTITHVYVGLDDAYKVPAMSVCFRYGEVFDHHGFAKKNADYNPDVKTGITLQLQSKATIKQLLNYTPNTSMMLTKCSVKSPSGFSFLDYTGANCSKLFSVQKFIAQEYVCYRIEENFMRNLSASISRIGNSMNYRGIVYSVEIDHKSFKRVNDVNICASDHLPNSYPNMASPFCYLEFRDLDQSTGKARFNRFIARFSKVITIRLQKPYDTDCIDYRKVGFAYKSNCYRDCLIELTRKHMQILPFSVINRASESNEYKIFGIESLANESKSKRYEELVVICSKKCRQFDCLTNDYYARVVPWVGKSISFFFSLPQEPSFHVIFVKRVSLDQVIVLCLSTLGTWFGFSFLSAFGKLSTCCKTFIAASPNEQRRIKLIIWPDTYDKRKEMLEMNDRMNRLEAIVLKKRKKNIWIESRPV